MYITNDCLRPILLIVLISLRLILSASPSSSNVIIDVNEDKGIALQHIGIYSDKLDESIFHVFIPYHNLCVDSPNAEVCTYAPSTHTDVINVGTIVSLSESMPTIHRRENLSSVTLKDLRRIHSQHPVDRFMDRTKSIIYFIDEQFYIPGGTFRPAIVDSSSSTSMNRGSRIPRPNDQAKLALEQVVTNKVGYDFLTEEQLAEIMPLVLRTDNEILDATNTKENRELFNSMIIGQTVHALKSCTLGQHEFQASTPSCLVVSTVLRRLPTESPSLFHVYHLIPLPIFFKGEKYIYSNLPRVFGFNRIDKKFILWPEDNFSAVCIVIKMIQCRSYPISIPTTEAPCLAELLSGENPSISNCQVSKVRHSVPSILNIKDNVWYFYPHVETFQCEVESAADASEDLVSINQPMMVTLPCGRPVRCSGIQLPTTNCGNTSIRRHSNHNSGTDNEIVRSITMNNITHRLVSIYQTTARKMFLELQGDYDMTQPGMRKTYERFGGLLASLASLMLFSIILFIMKIIRSRMARQVDRIQTEINRLERDFIESL